MLYLILCDSNSQGTALWWRPERCGYTTDVQQAGRYTKEEAESIQRIRGTDFPVPESDIGRILTPRVIVTVEDGNNVDRLREYRRQPYPFVRSDPTTADKP